MTKQWRVLPAIDEFYLQYIRTFFPSFNKVMSYMNTCGTVIVGTWVERVNVCRIESASMCPSLIRTEMIKNKNNQNSKVNQLILYLIVTRRLEIIYYTTKNVHLTIRTTNLSALESIFITLCKPNLSRQKEFVYKKKKSFL